MKKNIGFYLKLFTSTFYLSAFTFGGGYVIVPLMRKKFVEEYQWIAEDEMIDLVAIAQSSPGAIAVNASILIGYRLGGVLGSLFTIVGTVLPPLITLSIVSYFYMAFKDNFIVQTILAGMQVGVAAVILDVTISMAKEILKEKSLLSIVVMIIAFIAAYFFKVNVGIIIIVCGVLGMTMVLTKNKKIQKGK